MNIDLTHFRMPRYALAPEVVLTGDGPRPNRVVAIDGGKISTIEDEAMFRASRPDWPVLPLDGYAMIPGMVDAHTHAGQTFGKSSMQRRAAGRTPAGWDA